MNLHSCPGATPKVWESTPLVLHLDEHMLKGGARGQSPGSPLTSQPPKEASNQTYRPLPLCFPLTEWVAKTPKDCPHCGLRVTALEIVQKIPPRIIQIDGISFKDFLLALVYRKKATPFENYMQLGVLFKSLS